MADEGGDELIDELEKETQERERILKKSINWNAFVDVYYSRDDLNLISAFDKRILERADMLNQSGDNLARILTILMSNLHKDDLKYILTIVQDILAMEDVPNVLRNFESLSLIKDQGLNNAPFGPLFTILRDEEDPYTVSKASSILTTFLTKFQIVDDDSVAGAINFFVRKLQTVRPKKDDTLYFRTQIRVLENLREVLRKDVFRRSFVANHGLRSLFALLELSEGQQIKSFHIQLIYSALYCLWLVTFLKELRKSLVDPVFIRNLCFLVKTVGKDKVVRLGLAILKNLLRCGEAEKLMISYGLLKSLDIIKSKHTIMADKDIVDDLTLIKETLETIVDELTTFDIYRHEVLSTKLEWSPPHKSPKFWSENCFRFEEADNLLLRTLKQILACPETDPSVLIIACWDLGEFVRNHPRGRKILDNIDAKAPIMQLLSSKDQQVEASALLTLQKLLLTNWDLYAGLGNGGAQ